MECRMCPKCGVKIYSSETEETWELVNEPKEEALTIRRKKPINIPCLLDLDPVEGGSD